MENRIREHMNTSFLGDILMFLNRATLTDRNKVS